MSEPHEELLDELRPAAFAIAYRMLGSVAEAEDVVQEALLRAPPRARGGRADRVAARVRRRRWPPASRSTSCARRGCAARPTSASGCRSRSSPTRRRPGAPGRDGRLALARLPGPAREPVARAARGAAAARRVRLRLRRDRRDRRQERGQRPPARRAGAPARRGAAAALRGLARAARRAGAALLRRRPGGRRRGRWRRCSPTTWSSTATAAARCRRSRARCTAARRVARTLLRLDAAGRADPRRVDSARSRSTASPARCCSTATAAVIGVMALDIADGRIQGIRSIVNPDKLRHLGAVADARRC